MPVAVVQVKMFVDLGSCQGNTSVVGGACNGADILEKNGGGFPWRPVHGQLQDLLDSLSKVTNCFLERETAVCVCVKRERGSVCV